MKGYLIWCYRLVVIVLLSFLVYKTFDLSDRIDGCYYACDRVGDAVNALGKPDGHYGIGALSKSSEVLGLYDQLNEIRKILSDRPASRP